MSSAFIFAFFVFAIRASLGSFCVFIGKKWTRKTEKKMELPLTEKKKTLRSTLRKRRAALPDREKRSQRACQRVLEMPAWQTAKIVLVYVNFRSELETNLLIEKLLASPEKRCIVPFCLPEGALELVEIRSREELEPGAYGIPEPKTEVWQLPERIVLPQEIDLAVLPGVGFDLQGRRLGQGGGFYDRLLPKLRKETPTVGIAFECQLTEEIPSEPHDLRVQFIATEERLQDVRFQVWGLLGGIAGGKSLAADFFRQKEIPVFDADRAGHELYRRTDIQECLIQRWGTDILAEDGSLDRKKIARKVFQAGENSGNSGNSGENGENGSAETEETSKNEELAFLNGLFHPAIRQEWLQFRESAARNGKPLVILDAPLLLELGWQEECRELLFIETPRARQIRFALARGWTLEELEARERRQLPLTEKRAAATLCVSNSGTKEELAGHLEVLFAKKFAGN